MKKLLFILSVMLLGLGAAAQNTEHKVIHSNHNTFYVGDNDYPAPYHLNKVIVYYEWTPISGNFCFRRISETSAKLTAYSPLRDIAFKYYARYADGFQITLYVTGTVKYKEGGNEGQFPLDPPGLPTVE